MSRSKNYGTLHSGILCSREKKELIPFATAWMELKSIMVSEISQTVRNKYHMISPLTRTYSTKEKSKQNTTRDIEVKNNLTIARWGQWKEGITGTTIKDTWRKSKGRVEVGEAGGFSWGGVE